MERYYGITPSQADRALWLVAGVAVVLSLFIAIHGEWFKALPYLIAVATALATRWVRGPFVGKPLLELTESELIIRQPFYLPTKVQNLQLEHLRSLTIVGPRRDRRFRITFADGSKLEIRPYFRGAEEGAVRFIKVHLANVHIVEKDPPGILAAFRGDY